MKLRVMGINLVHSKVDYLENDNLTFLDHLVWKSCFTHFDYFLRHKSEIPEIR